MKNNSEQEVQSLVLAALEMEPATLSNEKFISEISRYINDLLVNRFDYLVSLLYRMDINEDKLRQLISAHPGEDAGNIIAALIIERQLQKIKTRHEFRKPDEDISEDEKW